MVASQGALARRFDARRLSPGARRQGAPKNPVAVELFFALATRRLVASYIAKIVRIALAVSADFAKPTLADDRQRTDAKEKKGDGLDKAREEAGLRKENAAKAKGVSKHMRAVAKRALRLGLPQFEARSKKAADRARAHSKNELGRLGVVVKKEPELRFLIDGWRKDSVARITGLAEEHVERIEGILADGFNKHPDTIARQVKQLGLMSDKRAEMIARDQVLTLNAQINRHRQFAAGVTSYIWTTQNDERVRDEHDELDGEEFDWDTGHPEEGHPGEPINCRCMAYPVPPSDKGDDEEDDE